MEDTHNSANLARAYAADTAAYLAATTAEEVAWRNIFGAIRLALFAVARAAYDPVYVAAYGAAFSCSNEDDAYDAALEAARAYAAGAALEDAAFDTITAGLQGDAAENFADISEDPALYDDDAYTHIAFDAAGAVVKAVNAAGSATTLAVKTATERAVTYARAAAFDAVEADRIPEDSTTYRAVAEARDEYVAAYGDAYKPAFLAAYGEFDAYAAAQAAEVALDDPAHTDMYRAVFGSCYTDASALAFDDAVYASAFPPEPRH